MDYKKLDNLNGHYIRELDDAALAARLESLSRAYAAAFCPGWRARGSPPQCPG